MATKRPVIQTSTSVTRQPHAAFVAGICRVRRLQAPESQAKKPLTYALVEQGRWLVRCPFCAGAELIDPGETWFYCLSCGNEEARGAWLPVQWPSDVKGIEEALAERRRPETRNWRADETVIDLLAQTLEREG